MLRTPTRTRTLRRNLLLGLLVGLCAACPDPAGTQATDGGPDPSGDAGSPAVELGATSTKNDLLWRRFRALEQGLARALLVDEGEMCEELGRFSCVNTVHLVALGGNEPFDQGLHEPVRTPTATTPVAVERLVWSACKAAVDADAGRPLQRVFYGLDLSEIAAPIDLEDQDQAYAVEDTITSLYRQLHAREPLEAERAELRALTVDDDGAPLRPRDFALLTCFAVASTTETVFF